MGLARGDGDPRLRGRHGAPRTQVKRAAKLLAGVAGVRLVAVQSELIEAWSAFEQSAVDVGTPPAHESEQTLTVSLSGRIPFVPGTGNTRLRRPLLAAQVGVPLSMEQRELLRTTARRVLVLRAELDEVEKRMRVLCAAGASLARIAETVGPAAATAIFADLGDPSAYGCAAALEKAAGLNLRERSSGKLQGRIHITKRGPARVGHYLYLASLRLILQSSVVRRWFEARRSFVPGTKHKAIVAIMRKLIRALFHVARGSPFDACKLFDARRLDLPRASATRTSELQPA